MTTTPAAYDAVNLTADMDGATVRYLPTGELGTIRGVFADAPGSDRLVEILVVNTRGGSFPSMDPDDYTAARPITADDVHTGNAIVRHWSTDQLARIGGWGERDGRITELDLDWVGQPGGILADPADWDVVVEPTVTVTAEPLDDHAVEVSTVYATRDHRVRAVVTTIAGTATHSALLVADRSVQPRVVCPSMRELDHATTCEYLAREVVERADMLAARDAAGV